MSGRAALASYHVPGSEGWGQTSDCPWPRPLLPAEPSPHARPGPPCCQVPPVTLRSARGCLAEPHTEDRGHKQTPKPRAGECGAQRSSHVFPEPEITPTPPPPAALPKPRLQPLLRPAFCLEGHVSMSPANPSPLCPPLPGDPDAGRMCACLSAACPAPASAQQWEPRLLPLQACVCGQDGPLQGRGARTQDKGRVEGRLWETGGQQGKPEGTHDGRESWNPRLPTPSDSAVQQVAVTG